MKAIAINGYQIHSWQGGLNHGVQIPIKGLGFPELRMSSYSKPGEYGDVVANVLYSGRHIQLTGWTFATNAALYNFYRRQLQSALTLQKDSNSNIIPISLTFTTLDDLSLKVDTYLFSFKMDVENNTGGQWQLDLRAPDYFFLAQSAVTYTITRASAGGAIIPAVIPILLAGGAGGTVSIVNNGDAESYPIIYLNGPLTNPLIQSNALGRYIQMNMTLTSTDQVVIDMKNKTAILNGVQSVNQNISSGSNFWWIKAGTNIITFQSDSVNDVGNAQIPAFDSYIGI